SSPRNEAVFVGWIRINPNNDRSPCRIAICPGRVVLSHAACCSVDWIQVHGRLHRRKLPGEFHMLLDGGIGQFIEEIRFPIPLKTGRINRVEHALQCRMRYWSNEIQSGFEETADRLEYLFGLVQCSGVAPDDSAHFFVVEMFRKRRSWRDSKKSEETIDVIRCLHDELAIPA